MKTKALLKSFALCLIAIFTVSAHAQISTNELPPSFSSSLFSIRSGDVINLPIPDVAEALHEDSLFADADIPYRVGLPLAVSYNLHNSGHWQSVGDSMRVWRLQLHASGAKAMTVSYDKFWIPEGAKFFVYNADKTFCIGAFTSFNNKGTRENPVDFATGFVAGEDIVLEYYEPIGVETGIVSVERVIYVYKNVLATQSNVMSGVLPGISMSCNVNINCSEGASWQKGKRAVAAIYNGNGALCTGALINNTENKDYFLSADHCFSNRYDAQGANQMNQLIFYWNYESPDCSNTYIYNPPSSAGAKLVANNSHSDFALLELTESVKNVTGYMPYYLGWTRSNIAATNAVGIHHPRGDIKKISVENDAVTSYGKSQNWVDKNGNIISTTQKNTHWKVVFDVGTTEGGSSGSPLMNQNHLVVGQLHGGDFGCAPITKYYGRFDVSWNYGSVATRRLKDWLDPDNTGMAQLEARDLSPIINGPSFINANSAYFSISNMPRNARVKNWSLSNMPSGHLGVGAHSDNSILYYQKYVTDHYDTKLTAEIILSDSTTMFISKDISVEQQDGQIMGNLDGTPIISYSQSRYVTSRASHTLVLNISRGLRINLDTSTGSASEANYSYDSKNRILYFSLAPITTGAPFRFKVSGENSCYNDKVIIFFVINSYLMNISDISETIKEISLVSDLKERSHVVSNWNIEVYNTSYAAKVLDIRNLKAFTYQLNTSGWAPGIYVVRAVIDGEVFTEKITVGK